MEDFNSELYKDQYVSKIQPQVLVVINAILARQHFIDAFESYNQGEKRGGTGADYRVYSRLYTLFLLLQDGLHKDINPEAFRKLKVKALSPANIGEALEVFDTLSEYMYDKKITRFDSMRLKSPDDLDDE